MLTIHYNHHQIPTSREFSIRLSWKNPACSMDELPGPVGLGIDIPVNRHSRTYFGNPERFDKYVTGSDRKFPGFEIRFKGVLLMTGTLNITHATHEIYSGWLQGEPGVLGEKQRDRNITDMEWEQGVNFVNKSLYDCHTDDYSTSLVRNRAFWNGKGRETTVEREYEDEDGQVHKTGDTITRLTEIFRRDFYSFVNYPDGAGVKVTGEGCVVSPYLFLRYVIREIFKTCGFYIDRNDMVKSPLDLDLTAFLLVYNNFNIMGQTMQLQDFQHVYFDFDLFRFVIKTEKKIVNMDWHLNPVNYSDLLPRVPLKDFLIGLQNYLNYVFCFKAMNKVDIIDRNGIIDGECFNLEDYFLGSWTIGERKNVTLKFISEFDKEDRMFSQEYHDLTDRRADFREAVDSLSELEAITDAEIGQLCMVKNSNKIYEYRWKVLTSEDILYRETQMDALGWEFISSGPQPFVYGTSDEIEKINTVFSTLQILHEYDGEASTRVTLQPGNLKNMKQSWNEFTPRLINNGELLYPGALNWEGEEGLFEKRWKKWARFWATRLPVEGAFDLPLNVICYIIRNITQKYRTVNGEFIIGEMETEFSSGMVGKTTIKGYKV